MTDSPVTECMENVAYNKACMSLNISHRESLSFAEEKMMAAITIVYFSPISALRVSSDARHVPISRSGFDDVIHDVFHAAA